MAVHPNPLNSAFPLSSYLGFLGRKEGYSSRVFKLQRSVPFFRFRPSYTYESNLLMDKLTKLQSSVPFPEQESFE